jgi:release factor glutamine methyltransferase
MTVGELIHKSVSVLQAADIPDADLETSFLLGHLLKMNRAQLLLATEEEVPGDIQQIFEESLQRRKKHEPLSYIIGEQEFWSLSFLVTPAVLIPRPETEFLLETTLKVLRRAGDSPSRILDLGVGSGVISVVLAREIPGAQVYGVDLSFPALKVARNNVMRHKVAGRVHLLNSDWLQALRISSRFDLVVSNPPYVDPASFPDLQPEVVSHEPHLALHGGEKGLAVIAGICDQLYPVLRPGAWFFMEIGADQGGAALDIFAASGQYANLAVYDDYAGHPRVLQARKI